MPNQELLAFIRKWLAEGGEPKKLKAELLSANWTEAQVDEALVTLGITTTNSKSSTEKPKETPQQKPAFPESTTQKEPVQAAGATSERSEVKGDSRQPESEPKGLAETKAEDEIAPTSLPQKTLGENVSGLLKNLPGLSAFKVPKHLRKDPPAAPTASAPNESTDSPQQNPAAGHTATTERPHKQAPAPDNLPVMPESAAAPRFTEHAPVRDPAAQVKPAEMASRDTSSRDESEDVIPAVLAEPKVVHKQQQSEKKDLGEAEAPKASSRDTGFAGPITLLQDAASIFAERFILLVGILLVPMIAASAFSMIADTQSGETLAQNPIAFAVLALIAVAVFILQAWGQVAVLLALKTTQPPTIIEAYRAGWSKILSYWWVSILAAFITLGGFFLFIIPGVIFAVWFSLALFILVAEDERGMNALLKSREYIRGHWWGVAGRFLVIMMIALALSLALELSLAAVTALPYGSSDAAFTLLNLFLVPLVLAYGFKLYESLRAQKPQLIFSASAGKKAVYVGAGALGILLVPGMLVGVAFLTLDDARQALEQAEQSQQQTKEQ